MLLKILVLTCVVFLPLGDGIKLGGGRGGTRGSGLNLGGGGRIRKQHTRKPGKPYFFNLLLCPELLLSLFRDGEPYIEPTQHNTTIDVV